MSAATPRQHAEPAPQEPAGEPRSPWAQPTFWDRNPEIGIFVTGLLTTLSQTEIRSRICARFGRDKTPSDKTLRKFTREYQNQRRAKARRQ